MIDVLNHPVKHAWCPCDFTAAFYFEEKKNFGGNEYAKETETYWTITKRAIVCCSYNVPWFLVFALVPRSIPTHMYVHPFSFKPATFEIAKLNFGDNKV